MYNISSLVESLQQTLPALNASHNGLIIHARVLNILHFYKCCMFIIMRPSLGGRTKRPSVRPSRAFDLGLLKIGKP